MKSFSSYVLEEDRPSQIRHRIYLRTKPKLFALNSRMNVGHEILIVMGLCFDRILERRSTFKWSKKKADAAAPAFSLAVRTAKLLYTDVMVYPSDNVVETGNVDNMTHLSVALELG